MATARGHASECGRANGRRACVHVRMTDARVVVVVVVAAGVAGVGRYSDCSAATACVLVLVLDSGATATGSSTMIFGPALVSQAGLVSVRRR